MTIPQSHILKERIVTTFLNLKNAIQASENINHKSSVDLWSVGEIAEHILLGSKVDFKNTQKSERAFDLHITAIKDFFLDYGEKHGTMPILQPENKEYSKSEILIRLTEFEKYLLNVLDNDDLTLECVDDNLLTGWGYLTKYEWMHLHEYHIIRHTRQINQLKQFGK